MKIMFRIVSLLLFTAAVSTISVAQDTRFESAEAGISVLPAAGWTIGVNSKGKPILWGPSDKGFRSNLNLRSDKSALSLKQYVDNAMSSVVASTKEIGTESTASAGKLAFKSTNGIPGYRLTFVSIYKGMELRTTMYIFAKPNDERKFLLTFTTVDSDTIANSRLDEIARSFKIDR